MTGQDIWATVQLEQAAGEYPLSMDSGDYGELQDGNWLSTNGGYFSHCYSAGNFGGAWLITLNCQGELIPGSWASINPTQGTVHANTMETVSLGLNSFDLAAGTYNANFVINTNDEDVPTFTIPISVTVNAPLGNLGYTTYDWQSNDGARTWTHVWPDGKVNFAFTQASNTSFTDRGTGIGTYDAVNDVWIPSSGRVESDKTGFGSIAQYGSNGLVVASHTATDCRIYIIPNKDNIPVNSLGYTSILNNTYEPTWPAVMTSGPNRDIIHVVATAYSNNIPGMENVTDPIIYFRSTDGGQTWDKQNVVLPFMTSEYALDWNSNCCYWMETTEDNCLALVVNNAWSDGMVIYSYDNGETWQRKVFYKHPNPFGDFTDRYFYYPRWTSCQWDSQHRLHVLYEFNGTTGEVGSGSYYPQLGGVAYWNEIMPYNQAGNTVSAIPENLIPGLPFVMDSAYLDNDIYKSWWIWSDATHAMWPEYMGYLAPLTDDGYPENPSSAMEFNLTSNDERAKHGHYNQGVCGFPVLCVVDGTDEMVAVWSALDENHTDSQGNYYYKLFASYSSNGGTSWSPMVHLTNTPACNQAEFIYNQAAVVGRKLIVASQTDAMTGSFVQSDDGNAFDNYYAGFVFNIDELFDTELVPHYSIAASVTPSGSGTVTGAGSYFQGSSCTLTAIANTGYDFLNWTRNGVVVSTNPRFSFTVTGNASYVANFEQQISYYQVMVFASPVEGGVVTGSGTYAEGSVCTVTATANTGYHFVNWTKNGTVVSTNASFSFNVTENASYVAHFSINSYNVTVSADPTNGGVVGGAGTYSYGAMVTVTATPAGGYTFVNWTKNGVQVSTMPNYSFTVTESVNLVAHFTLNGYIVTVSADPAEGGIVEGSGGYEYGETVTVNATANTGYTFVNWTKNGVQVSTEAEYSFVVTESVNLVAHFTVNSYTVTVSVDPADAGFVEGAGTFNYGTLVTLTATANTGYTFVNWTNNGVQVSTDAQYSFTLTESVDLVAHFILNSYNVTLIADPAEGGNLEGGGVYNHGETATVNATANYGYSFVNWTMNGVQVSTDQEYSFTVTEPVTLIAHFTLNSYTVTVSADPAEGGSVMGTGTYYFGTSISVTATANTGYTFVNWTMNGVQVSAQAVYSFTVTESVNLVAHFSLNSCTITVSADPAEGGAVSGAGSYDYGTTIMLTATPNEGYDFVNWTKNGNVVSSSPSFSFNVTEDAAYVAHFILQIVNYQISVSASPVEGGLVSGGGTYAQGSVCTVSATANAGYTFENWTKNGNVVSTNTSFSFNVTEDASYVAHFSQIYYTVNAVADPIEGGVVSGAGTYPYGSLVTLSVTLNPNYLFVNWTENGEEVSTEESYTFALTSSRNLVANLMYVEDVDEYSFGSFQVFPNPCFEGGEVFIIGLGDVRTTVELYDALGAMVMRKEVVDGKISLATSLKAGVYLLKAVSVSGRVSCSKLMIIIK